jgi:segregation and condensation protein A
VPVATAIEPSPARGAATVTAVATATSAREQAAQFEVHLDVFAGPFDLLLRLIGKHELDLTLVALAQVTDEFVAHLRAGGGFDLDEATDFLVVAATLLDLKAARLLPSVAGDDEEDLALFEARDLLFARLLQYRAYKGLAVVLGGLFSAEQPWIPREVSLQPDLAAALPDVVVGVGAERLAAMAAAALAPRSSPQVPIDHLHVPRVNVREHAAIVLERLQEVGTASFRSLCSGCKETIEVVARFLAVLELFREGRVSVEQIVPMGDLQVRWVTPPAEQAPGAEPGGDDDYR